MRFQRRVTLFVCAEGGWIFLLGLRFNPPFLLADREGGKMTGRNPFRDFDRDPKEEHPLHKIARENPQIKTLTLKIREATKRLIKAMGDDHSPWLQLDELINDHLRNWEEVFFNLGYEHGYISGEGDAFQKLLHSNPDERYRKLVDELRVLLTQSNLPESLSIAALLETAWAVCLKLAKQQGI